MEASYKVSARGHLLLVVQALQFAKEQNAGSPETKRKITLALQSARADEAKLPKLKSRKKRGR